MKSNDITQQQRDTFRLQMQQAAAQNDSAAFAAAWDGMCQLIGADLRQEYDTRFQQLQEDMDSRILAARGARQLTSEERSYYGKLIQAMQSADPRQAVASMTEILPRTVIESVFDDLQTEHPLLSHINFIPSSGAVELMISDDEQQAAVWGDLTAKVIEEITASYKKIPTTLMKLSAFMLVCKSMLELGPEWLDRYVRECLYEALANGMEAGCITGTGKNMPIGMDRQVGDGVNVVDGAYPQKEAIPVDSLDSVTLGDLLARLAKSPKGKYRRVQDVLLIVNPVDNMRKVTPATTVQGPDGTYHNHILPYPMTVIESPSVAEGRAILGLGKRYLATAGTAKTGKIEYSDQYHFLEDERAYLVKAYANGMPKDNTSFLLLDISGLKPAAWKIEMVDAAAEPAAAAEE